MTETLYVAVVIGDGPYYGMVPDFSLMASGDTVDGVVTQLQTLTNESVALSRCRNVTAHPSLWLPRLRLSRRIGKETNISFRVW